MKQIQIDIGLTKDSRYFLDIGNERVLVSEKLGEIMDRVERESLKFFDIKKKGRFSMPWSK